MVRRAISGFEPPLVVPSDNAALDALIDALDAVGEESDMFRRARAATATRYLRRRDFEEALYEALHAHPDTRQAVTEALAALR